MSGLGPLLKAARSKKPPKPGAADPAAPAEKPQVPPLRGGNLLADINTIAETWFKRRWFDPATEKPRDLSTPEELVAAAGDRGIEVRYEQRSLESLSARDFPCVALERDGTSRIITERPAKDRFVCRTGGQVETLPLRQLKKAHSGVIFFVSPKADPSVHDPAAPVEEAEDPKARGLLGTVWAELMFRHKNKLVQLCVASGLSNLFLIALPMFSMSVYDRVVPHLAMETLWALAIGVMIALISDLAVRYVRLRVCDSIGLNTSTAIQARLYSRILHVRLAEAPALAGGINNGLREVEALCQLMPLLIVSVLIDLPTFILFCLLLFALSGPLALVPLVGVVLMLLFHLTDVKGERVQAAARLSATQTNVLLETVNAVETVKVARAERPLLRRWERLVDASTYVGHLTRINSAFSGQASLTVTQTVVVLAMIIGVYEIGAGAMTIGALSASTLLISRMMAPVSQLISLAHRAHVISLSTRTIDHILRMEVERGGDPTATKRSLGGSLQFVDAGFTYPGEKTACLTGISLSIAPGERVGIIGRVGSGKSTLLKLIVRLHDATTGAIRIDDHDIRQTAPSDLRRHFGFMRQDAVLLDDTLRNAVCLGLEDVPDEVFESAVRISGVKDFAARHPAGYSMRVGPRGERLSGGERQSVALARALVGSPRALVLDEPTAAMDNTLENRIVRDLRETLGDRTLIVATHRAPLLGLVDRLIWIENGRVVADGPKAEVLERLNGRGPSVPVERRADNLKA